MVVWLLKAIASYVFNQLMARIGHTAAADHFKEIIASRQPLKPDLPPAESRNPNLGSGHYGG
jgi:hypothetical protein